MRRASQARQSLESGFSLIEVLISLLIVVVGLLGLAGIQARAQIAELESYQRAQALVLLYDMMDRINNSRTTAPCYVVTTNTTTGAPYFGTGATATAACSLSNPADQAMAVASMNAWNNLLQGASERKGAAATNVGAMIGARGCVSYDVGTEYINATTGANVAGTGEYTVAVSWQGMADTFAPTKACGAGLYGTAAASDTKRRTVWATMRIGTLATR
jgi:type IV pilus assembly protein PilV